MKKLIQTNLRNSLILIFAMFSLSNIDAQYLSGDTSVCPGSTNTYTFSPGPWTFTVLGGGTIQGATTGNSVIVKWGNVSGNYQIRLVNGAVTRYQKVIIEGDFALACDDLVNVSLDGNCEAVITPEMVIEDKNYPDDSYTVTVYNTNGSVVPNNKVTGVHLGQTLKVHVKHNCSGITCWAYIFIEDKYIPSLLCKPTAYIAQCGSAYDPQHTGFPVPSTSIILPSTKDDHTFIVRNFDKCCDVELNYYDVVTKNGCGARPYYTTVLRYWSAKDCKGNSTSCLDTVGILEGNLDHISCPENYDGLVNPYLNCKDKEPAFGPYPAGWNALDNGNPSPYDYRNNAGDLIWKGTGYPTNTGCDHLATTYRDIKIPVCGASFKLLRNWKVFNWCTGEVFECTQLIKVIDDEAPLIACPARRVFPADYYTCGGSINLPFPTVLEECSGTTVKAGYIIDEPDGTRNLNHIHFENVTVFNDHITITGLPADSAWIQFYVTDACGNQSTCRTEIEIIDNLDPVAVCDENTVISLNEDGFAKLYATSINNGSFDNCAVDTMLVRRMTDNCAVTGNDQFGSYVTFCCADIAKNPIQVVFRVFDKEGNYNDCMTRVTVQDKIPPTITCPRNVTVTCETDITDLSITGRATGKDNCDNLTITFKDDSIPPFKCGFGIIKRTWKATDAGGRFAICEQLITVQDNAPFTCTQVIWPRDITVNGCSVSDGHPDIAGKPVFPTGHCKNIIAGNIDEPFYNVDGYCVKIIRHWKVIDWCQYDVNNPNSAGICTRDQLIFVRNTSGPTLKAGSCTAKTFCAETNCEAQVDLSADATDDCTDANDLVWKYSIDLDNNGSVDFTGTTKSISKSLKTGVHKVSWEVKDACGNTTTCTQTVTVNDCKLPTPYCKPGIITVIMPSTGRISIWARDFNEASFDNCTPANKLRYSFSSNVRDTGKVYTCDSIPNGREAKFKVTVYVTDEAGNQDFCITEVIIQDNIDNVCPNKFTNGGMISGLIMANPNSPLRNAELNLFEKSNLMSSINSLEDGHYLFMDIVEGNNYLLRPYKNDDIMNGITTADIVMIQKHILGIQPFESPYQFIAADVNNNTQITASDMAELRKLILGISSELKNGQTSWRFIKADHKFENSNDPWSPQLWPEETNIDNLQGEALDKNFIAVKVGDLNHTAKTNLANKTVVRTSEKLYFEIEAKNIEANSTLEIPVYGKWNTSLAGFQMAIHFDASSLEFMNIKPGALNVSSQNLGLNNIDNGVILMSWNGTESTTSTDKPLFTLLVNTKRAGNISKLINISSEGLNAEAYDDQLNVMDIVLRERNSAKLLSGYELYQNVPNPFGSNTTISFYAPQQENVNLSIFDLSGKIVYNKNMIAKKGTNHISLVKAELGNHSGILYYKLESSSYTATRKMILNP